MDDNKNFWENYYDNMRNEELWTYQSVINIFALMGISFKYP
tara:strand:- start:86 stop:208 length:123 start_codon:yes stop_codon:yes gene_type:complete